MSRNKYQDICYVCGLSVLIGTGHFQREGNDWLTKHAMHPGDGRVTCEMAKEADQIAHPNKYEPVSEIGARATL